MIRTQKTVLQKQCSVRDMSDSGGILACILCVLNLNLSLFHYFKFQWSDFFSTPWSSAQTAYNPLSRLKMFPLYCQYHCQQRFMLIIINKDNVWCHCPDNCSHWWKKKKRKNHLKCLLLSSTLAMLGVDNYFASLAQCVYFISCYYMLILLSLQFGKSSISFYLTDGSPKPG